MKAKQGHPTKEAGLLRATDVDLVRRARLGDEAASHELIDRYAWKLYALAFSLVGNAADAEDVLQETFSGAIQGLKSFQERSAVKTWLVRILVRQAARCLRSRTAHRTVSLDALSIASLAALSDGAGASETERIDIRMDVLAMLDALSADHREAIVLREFEGMSYQEIADVLHVPRGTVESRLFRARKALAERLEVYQTKDF